MTATEQQTFTITYDQLIRLAKLGDRARSVVDELVDIDEEAMAIVYDIAGPFASGSDEEQKFFELAVPEPRPCRGGTTLVLTLF